MALAPYVSIPLGTAFLYAVAALALKRAMHRDVGPWRATFVSNWVMALLFLPFWLTAHGEFTWPHFLKACLAGVMFFAGQIFTFLALGRGDVSVATPLLGTKVIFVAFFTVIILGQGIPAAWWVAAFLAALAATLLRGRADEHKGRHALTVSCALLSAASFALTDILVQKWSAAWGFTRFAPTMFLVVGVLSFSLLPFFSTRLKRLPEKTWRWLLPGSLLLALQSAGMAFVISEFGHAAVVNIVYSSRGIWSVLLVWVVGHWFENLERGQGHRVMATRLAGSALIVFAIWLVVG